MALRWRGRQNPMSKPLERHLQATVLRKLKALRAQDDRLAFRKRHAAGMGVAGDPDVYGVWRGVAWEVELKAPGEEPTPLQWARLREWELAGCVTGVINSPQAFDSFLARLRSIIPWHEE